MSDVTHMKWWGWGVPEHSFSAADKPALAPFIRSKLGVDVTAAATPPPSFDDLTIPESAVPPQLLTDLVAAVGEEHLSVTETDRVIHTYGKSIRDLLRVRRNQFPRVPDIVVFPGTESEVVAVTVAASSHNAVLIPFGGGSNIVGAVEPVPDETRPVVSVDMGRMRRVLDIDPESGLATIQAGAQGPDLEAQLNIHGWTVGHFPDSFAHSTVGGWIATRSSGMQSDAYGDMADITRGLRMVLPDGDMVVLHPLPSSSSGPSVREMILGSEGRLGIITEATVNVHRLPEVREIQAYLFPDYASGLEAMRDISESDAHPTVTRVSDGFETAFSFATAKRSHGIGRLIRSGLLAFLGRRGWNRDDICVSFVGFEGSLRHVRYEKALVKKIVQRNGGIGVGQGPGALYDQKKFDTPYIRDFLLDRGALADVSETASPWGLLGDVHEAVIATFNDTITHLGVSGYIMCHLSHSYHSGACQYFTFAIADVSPDAEKHYDAVKQAIQQAFVNGESAVSHHHGVGEEHSPWLADDISPGGVRLQRALFDAIDPDHRANPGKIIHDGAPGVSSNSVEYL